MSELIPAEDRGFTLGDGLFETVLVENGRLAFWPEHFARLSAGCVTLGLPAPDPHLLAAAAGVALAGRTGRLALRLTVSAGSGGRGLERPAAPELRIVATAAPAPLPTTPVSLATAETRRNDRSPSARLKSLSYLDNVLARREARARGAEEAVMLNTRGDAACAAAGNLFWLAGERLVTPTLACGVLAGIMRARVMAAAGDLGVEVIEMRTTAADLASAEAIWVSNSLIGLRPAASLDGRALQVHALGERLGAQVAQTAD